MRKLLLQVAKAHHLVPPTKTSAAQVDLEKSGDLEQKEIIDIKLADKFPKHVNAAAAESQMFDSA
jgi:hypothetical protein